MSCAGKKSWKMRPWDNSTTTPPALPRAPLSHPRECGNGGHGCLSVTKDIALFVCRRQTRLCLFSCWIYHILIHHVLHHDSYWFIWFIWFIMHYFSWCFLSPVVGQRCVIKIYQDCTRQRLGCPMPCELRSSDVPRAPCNKLWVLQNENWFEPPE